MKFLHFAIVCNVEGINPGAFWPRETFPRDIDRYMRAAGIPTDYREDENAKESADYLECFSPLSNGDQFATADGSGILPARDFFGMLSEMGAIFEDCETMGTLGGPLGSWVNDFAFTHESQTIVFHMRATPCAKTENGFAPISRASSWGRIRNILRACDPWRAARGNLSELQKGKSNGHQ